MFQSFYAQKGGRGYYDSPSKFFFPTEPKHFVEEPFCAVSENFRNQKSSWMMAGGGGYHDFLSINFCHTVPKLLVLELFVSLILGTENIYA